MTLTFMALGGAPPGGAAGAYGDAAQGPPDGSTADGPSPPDGRNADGRPGLAEGGNQQVTPTG